MSRQYVACAFKGQDRTYTYHNDGAPVAVGDLVTVEGRHGTGAVTVREILSHPPSFPTKPILGPAPDKAT